MYKIETVEKRPTTNLQRMRAILRVQRGDDFVQKSTSRAREEIDPTRTTDLVEIFAKQGIR